MRNNMSIFHTKTFRILHTFRSQIWFMSSIRNSEELDFYNVDLEALCANAFTTPGKLNNAAVKEASISPQAWELKIVLKQYN